MAEFELKSYQFRREREESWKELDVLLHRIDKRGIRSLDAQQLSRVPLLYRATLSSLSVARAISLDRNLIDYLENLAGRAYLTVYGTKRRMRDAIGQFVLRRFPAALCRYRWHVALSFMIFFVGVLAGYLLTLQNQDRFYSFVSSQYSQGRNPAASTESLRAVLYDRQEKLADTLMVFATFLFSNNAQVGMLCFALGFVAGIPVFYLLLQNGLLLGAFGALYHSRGLSLDFWGWVLPHGVTELSAVVLCGAAGLLLGQSLVFPGLRGRMHNLARTGREAGVIVLGAILMLFVAALIEGLFRQLVLDIRVRYAVALGTALIWLVYFPLLGREKSHER